MRLSIVIPLAPRENAWRGLLKELCLPFADHEILLVSPEASPADLPAKARWLRAEAGRARQLNAGARAARGRWIWFVHADTRLGTRALQTVERVTLGDAPALHYFDLQFQGDGPAAMPINALGAFFRSRYLKMPFGDQAFLVPASVWRALGGFSEALAYGEDHVFAWAVRRAGLPLVPAGVSVATSARKYARQGWGRTTARHLAATYRQAFGEWRKTFHPWRKASAAVAIFVKTPGLSPTKTRLAAGTSADFAQRFYRATITAMQDLAEAASAQGLAPYWAVAESAGAADPLWSAFPVVAQGEGGLGARLARVYAELLRRHRCVIFLGCDCPHVSSADLQAALAELERADFVFGPAADGGFFLFAGRKPIEPATWQSVTYSTPTTMAELALRLGTIGAVAYLPAKTDVDTREDLAALRAELAEAKPERFSGAHWARLRTIARLSEQV